ncbi:hypothetical protein ACFCXA_05405 [Streptomyces virginiae]|uniref:hypothetical protein n=1 Tax=Streptomyces virginiae TaxID=1961 RepID=UPI00324E5666
MRRLVPAMLAMFALVGCTAQGSQDDGDPAGSNRPTKDSEAAKGSYTYRLPIAAYSYTDAEYASIAAAEHMLARTCMARFSLTYQPPPPNPPQPSADRRYGLSDEKSAALFGYRMDPSEAPKQPPQLDADVRAVLYGKREDASVPAEYRGQKVPENGCLGQAQSDLRKDYSDPEGAEAASRISSQSYEQSMQLPEVQAGFRNWSACMQKNGYTYASPRDPFAAQEFREGPVTEREKATAGADVACKRRTGLLDVWFTEESKLQTAMIAKDRQLLQKLQDVHRQKVAAAKAILAKG